MFTRARVTFHGETIRKIKGYRLPLFSPVFDRIAQPAHPLAVFPKKRCGGGGRGRAISAPTERP